MHIYIFPSYFLSVIHSLYLERAYDLSNKKNYRIYFTLYKNTPDNKISKNYEVII